MKDYARSRAWCEWTDFDTWRGRALRALDDPLAPATPPFHLLSLPGITAAQQRQCAERWMLARLRDSAPSRALLAIEFAANPAADRPHQPIRIGYLSSDFHQHATSLLMVEMLEAHDRDDFTLHAYSSGADDGLGMRQRLCARFDSFTDIRAMDDMQAARAIHADGIDILVDLKGFTAGSRTELLTYRPAPVQVSFLGYPGTVGGDFCDYLISDSFVIPAGASADYSESVARLPDSYQPHGRQARPGVGPSRSTVGLPEQGLVFCCFNQAFKFTPAVFDVWCALLDRTAGSVLWLLHDDRAEGNLRREAMRRGIRPDRLVFAPDRPQAEHLARLSLADLVLDTLPYNAHTTASDALWVGVPVLTCAGDTFAARVAGSLLRAVGLSELITHSLEDYADLALSLAGDPARLAGLRRRLLAQRMSAPLFDVPRYTASLEALFRGMWHRHRNGLAPAAMGAVGTALPYLDSFARSLRL